MGERGLGLAIVNQIVADHGGHLRLLENEPRGTLITMEFPTELGEQSRQEDTSPMTMKKGSATG